MPENGAKEGLEKAVEEKLLRKLHKTYVRRMRPPIALDADEFDQQREEVRRAIREDLAVIIPALLSTGELVERERLLNHLLHEMDMRAELDEDTAERVAAALELALHTATQSKEGQDG